jgi:hypothetical protein
LSPFNPFIPEKANAKLENIFPVSKYLWKIFSVSKYLWKIFSQPISGRDFFKNRIIKLRVYFFRIKNYFE